MTSLLSSFTFAIVCIAASAVQLQAQTTNLPKSREATFVEAYSPSEVTLRAKGIGRTLEEAETDSKKAAVDFVLRGMTDAVLQTAAEKEAFNAKQETFFETANIANYITFFGNQILSRVSLSDGTIRAEKFVRVNKEKLKNDMIALGVATSKETIATVIGNPVIMVLPEVPKGENPMELIESDPDLKKGAEVIESFLTARRYDVKAPEQMSAINDLNQMQLDLKGVEEDLPYKLAMSIGADVYIVFNSDVQKGAYGGRKAVVACRAYETTTARLLGTETGYSPERPSVPDAALIEEAMGGAIDKVLTRIDAYWKADIVRGIQYKLIFKITGKFSDPYAISDAIDDALKELTSERKQITASEKTVDYTVWQKKYDSSSRFFRDFAKALEQNEEFKGERAKLKRINVNRKILLLSVEK
ncbi:MAG: hypothetical protein IAF08_08325 [Rhizobacter sp.]|nr:hypothetical protein [Chlorobiales bacterium]